MLLALLGDLSIEETDLYTKRKWIARVNSMVSLLEITILFTYRDVCQASPWKRPEDPPRSEDTQLISAS